MGSGDLSRYSNAFLDYCTDETSIQRSQNQKIRLPYPPECSVSDLLIYDWSRNLILAHGETGGLKMKCSKEKYSFLKTRGQIHFWFKSTELPQE